MKMHPRMSPWLFVIESQEIIRKVSLAVIKVEEEVRCLGSWDHSDGFVMVDL
jgi:hypothetical protein